MKRSLLVLAAALAAVSIFSFDRAASAADPLKALIVDGQNNHDWKSTTPMLEAILENSGRFDVDVATSPPKGGDMSTFKPEFSKYDVVVLNYNGQPWSEETQKAFAAYVTEGGGVSVVHAANNSFPEWPEYNEIIGLGGWGGRSEKSGPYVRFRDGEIVKDTSEGRGGSHGRQHEFLLVTRAPEHPIVKGLPKEWRHAQDELYDRLRGPAENLKVLATAFSDPSTGGTGEHEPILFTIDYGKGRVFHTTMGHGTKSLEGVGFQITLQRGSEWAATGEVTLPGATADELPADKAAHRDPREIKPAAEDGAAIQVGDVQFVALLEDKEEAGWVELFNGENLEGWTQRNGKATYAAEDGAVVGRTAKGSPNSFLCTDKTYGDFELVFEVKVDNGLNSGVQIRSQTKDDKPENRVNGPQVEIESSGNNGAEAGYIYGEAAGGWMTKPDDLKPHKHFKDGEWNQYRVVAKGPRIMTWINGTQIEDLVDEEKFKSHPEGFIGLQVHGVGNGGPFEVRWRNIKLRDLTGVDFKP